MPKKPEFAKGNKSDKEHSPIKDRTQKPGRREASYNGGGHEKMDREMKLGDTGEPIDDMGKSTGGETNVFDDIRKLSRGKKSNEGCFPKLFMLLLSIMTGAAYFFLSS